MTANITIQTGRISNALMVPAVAIQQTLKGSFVKVAVKTNGQTKINLVPVKTGGDRWCQRSNSDAVVLTAGQQIVLARGRPTADGSKRPQIHPPALRLQEDPVAGEGKPKSADPIIQIRQMFKLYEMGGQEVRALDGVDLNIFPGEYAAIMGPSGSGKSTLMHMIGCLDVPTEGSYMLDGIEVAEMDEVELAHIRNKKIGFVFQGFNLLSRTTALENVMLPLVYGKVKDMEEKATIALQRVGLGDRLDHHPEHQLSGGQQQRVAIARAIATQPRLLLADEPTGNVSSTIQSEGGDYGNLQRAQRRGFDHSHGNSRAGHRASLQTDPDLA